MSRFSQVFIIILLAVSGFGAFGASGAGRARSIELRYGDGTRELLEVDSTMRVEFHDGEIAFTTSRGHLTIAPEGLKGWTYSEEEALPLLNDLVTGEGRVEAAEAIRSVRVEGRSVAVGGLADDRVIVALCDVDGRIVAMQRGADGDVVSPELRPGVYVLGVGDKRYKILVR